MKISSILTIHGSYLFIYFYKFKQFFLLYTQAAKADFAGIILWDTVDWTQLCSLHSHTLTVTQMAFSHNGNFLLSVSRDRTWAVYRKKTADQPESGTRCSTTMIRYDKN